MARLPHIKAPMAATQVARAFHRPGWVYEEKVDGWRVLTYKDAAGVRLVSRNARDLTRRFPGLAAAARLRGRQRRAGAPAVLDSGRQ